LNDFGMTTMHDYALKEKIDAMELEKERRQGNSPTQASKKI